MQTAQINIKVDGQQANASVADLNKNLSNTVTKTVSLRTELRQVTQELQRLQPGSQRFQELSQRAGQLRDTIQDTNSVINATAGSPIQNLGKGLQGIASIGISAFQGIASAQALFGAESEDLQKTLVKLQALAGLSQAITQLGGLSDTITDIKTGFIAFGNSAKASLAGIKGAVAATGIGLLLVAVGTLVAYWDDIKGAISGVSSEQQKLNKLTDKNYETSENKLKTLKNQDNILKLQGLSEKQILQRRILQTEETIKDLKLKIKNAEFTLKTQLEAEKRNKEIIKGLLQFSLGPIDLILKTIDGIGKFLGKDWNLSDDLRDWMASFVFDPEETEVKGKETIDKMKETLNQLTDEQAGYKLEIMKMDNEAAANNKKNQEDRVKDAKDANDKILKDKRRTEDLQVELMKDGREKELKQNENYYNRLKEDIEKSNVKLSKEEQDAIELIVKLKNKKKDEINEKYDKSDKTEKRKKEDEEIALIQNKLERELKLNQVFYERKIEDDFDAYLKTTQIIEEGGEKKVTLDKKFLDKIENYKKEKLKKEIEIYKEHISEQSALIKEFQDKQIAMINFEIANLEDGVEKQKKIRELQYTEERNALLNQYGNQLITKETYLKKEKELVEKYAEDITDIEVYYDDWILQEKAKKMEQKVQLYGDYIMEYAQGLVALQNVASENQINKINDTYDAEMEKLSQLRDAKILGDTQYENKKKELEQQRAVDEKKVKMEQFKRNKALNIAEAIMAGALAVLRALSAAPPPYNYFLAGLAAGAATAQVGVIAKQQFRAAKGGIVPKNGLPGDVDSVDAKLAPGEAVINSRSTAMFPNVLSLINQAGGGQPLVPEMTQQTSGGGGMVFSQNQPQAIRAYVVETEMSDTQRRINRIQKAVEF